MSTWRRVSRFAAFTITGFLTIGCGQPDAGLGTIRLVTSAYTIAPGEAFYQCQRLTVDHDVYLHALTVGGGPGTHHVTVSIDPRASLPDGVDRCDVPMEAQWLPLFASTSSPSLTLPPGVALAIPRGAQLVMNVHLLDATDDVMTGEASLDVDEIAPVDDAHRAEVVAVGVAPGSTAPSIAPGVDQLAGQCTMTGRTNVLATFPHMNGLGTHLAMTVRQAGSDTVVYDNDYSLDSERFVVFPHVVPLEAQDRLQVECTYDNETGAPVTIGAGAGDEACEAITWRYPIVPAVTTAGVCAE